ncbi:DUF3014 domain-containing protein [Psychromonas sp. SP041]|uniref:DUF3014 domain-containing protein n=1 Tax=Psychromonas sp. SP041 TaxID=1365007 RepID=UPI000428A5E7|nr:DUF3014 domain-containing protein [Psychromonas sp. SP041]
MAYPDLPKEKPYSWLNIILIAICVSMFGYSIFYFTYPNEHHRLMERLGVSNDFNFDFLNEPVVAEKPIIEEDVIEEAVDVIEPSEVTTLLSAAQPTEVVEEVEEENPLPLLDESDDLVLSAIDEFSETALITDNLLQSGLIRSTVVFIDNFSRGDLITSFSPLFPPKEPFKVKRSDGKIYVSIYGYKRYDDYSNYIASLDSQQLVQAYNTFKPLVDESYAEVAREGTKFDDVLNDAIDMALSVPVINGPITLKSPSVMYLFNNPALESLNDAQKLLLRLGPDNLTKVQDKLRSIQAELVKQSMESDEVYSSSTLEKTGEPALLSQED